MFFKNACAAALVAFLALLPIHGAQAQEKYITVVNNTSNTTIWYIYFSSVEKTGWGPDQLGGKVLAPGNSRSWNIPWTGCWIDIKAATFWGESVSRKVNVCGGETWTLYDK